MIAKILRLLLSEVVYLIGGLLAMEVAKELHRHQHRSREEAMKDIRRTNDSSKNP